MTVRLGLLAVVGVLVVPAAAGGSDGWNALRRPLHYVSRWFGEKVFWFVMPSYRGRVLIRGRRIDAPGRVGFNGTKTPNAELRIEPYDRSAGPASRVLGRSNRRRVDE